MRILRLARARVVLWARERHAGPEQPPFEVSRVVESSLQPRCPSAPRCPGEDQQRPFAPRAAWIDPDESPVGACPYQFQERGECLEHRNQRALEAALFRPGEARQVMRLLEALGFEVSEETVDPISEPNGRILRSHGYIGQRHEVRVLKSPAGGQIVLVREQGGRRRKHRRTPRARPIGGLS